MSRSATNFLARTLPGLCHYARAHFVHAFYFSTKTLLYEECSHFTCKSLKMYFDLYQSGVVKGKYYPYYQLSPKKRFVPFWRTCVSVGCDQITRYCD